MFRLTTACFLLYICVSYGHTSLAYHRQDIIRDIFTNYSKNVAPQDLTTDAVDVNITFYLQNILDLEETGETLISSGWMDISWSDFRLYWKPSLYGHVNHIYISRNAVWIPDITIANTATQQKVVGHQNDNLKITSEGLVRWNPGDVFRTGCSLDTTDFPFDEQTCKVVIIPWSYVWDDVRITSAEIRPSLKEEHGEWAIADVKACIEDVDIHNVTRATVYIDMYRRSTFYVFNIILPVIMTTFLNAFVFLLPAESGEKITLATALFLSYAVFLSYITDNMPSTSTSVSVLGVFVTIQLVLSGMSILCTVLTLNLHQRKVKNQKTGENQEEGKHFGNRLNLLFFVTFLVFGLLASGALLIMLDLM